MQYKKTVLLDRDGVINKNSAEYIKSVTEFIPIEGAIEAISLLNHKGYRVVVCTNQSGIARGLFNIHDLIKMHYHLHEMVNLAGGNISLIAYCPHHPNDGCDCRKPKTGLAKQVESHIRDPLIGSDFVGDSISDLEFALNAQLQPVLVLTGHGQETQTKLPAFEAKHNVKVDVFDNIVDYVVSKKRVL